MLSECLSVLANMLKLEFGLRTIYFLVTRSVFPELCVRTYVLVLRSFDVALICLETLFLQK